MDSPKQWVVCLDLTNMDNFLIEYVNFLAGVFKPDKIRFLHIIEQSYNHQEMKELFPDLHDPDEMKNLVRDEIEEKLSDLDQSTSELTVDIETGNTTDAIIRFISEIHADLLIMGKKSGYEGEGVISKKVVRYIPCSALLVPETSRLLLEQILIPVNFNEQSAKALQFAVHLSGISGSAITAQHIYHYPPQFFPGIPVDEFREKMQEPLEAKLMKFKKKYSLDNVTFKFTLNQNSRMPEKVYDQAVRDQADMILAGAKNQDVLSRVLLGDLADKLIQFTFGIPLFIFKERKKQ